MYEYRVTLCSVLGSPFHSELPSTHSLFFTTKELSNMCTIRTGVLSFMIALQYGILLNMSTLLYKILSNTGTLQFELLSTIITPYYGVLSNMNNLKCDMVSLSAFLISASTGYRLLAGLVDECRVLCVLGKQRAEQTVYLPLGLLQGELETRRGQEEAARRLPGESPGTWHRTVSRPGGPSPPRPPWRTAGSPGGGGTGGGGTGEGAGEGVAGISNIGAGGTGGAGRARWPGVAAGVARSIRGSRRGRSSRSRSMMRGEGGPVAG